MTDLIKRWGKNVTLPSIAEQIVLGLKPVIESCTSENIKLVFQKLKEFKNILIQILLLQFVKVLLLWKVGKNYLSCKS